MSRTSETRRTLPEMIHQYNFSREGLLALNKGGSIQHEVATNTILHEISEGIPPNNETIQVAVQRTDTRHRNSTIALLNFLSGYRSTLHRLTSRGAYSTILSLVLSAYLSSPDNGDAPLSAQWMRDVTLAQIADLARIRTHREEDHPTLGRAVKVGVKDEEAFEVLQLLVGPLNETGRILQEAGVKSLGVWLRESLERAEGNGYQVVREVRFPPRLRVSVVPFSEADDASDTCSSH